MASSDLPPVNPTQLPPVPDTNFAATHIPAEVDVVICGGGTVGSIVASRLSAADPNLRILVLEAGPPTLNDNMHMQPAMFIYHLRPDSTTARFIVGQPNPALNGRQSIVPTGQCIGGGSSINFTMYTRAAASDYDDWENIHGNQGWGSKDLIPLIQKAENYQVAPAKERHGYDGPLNVSYGGIFTNIGKEFLETAVTVDKDRELGDDTNDSYKNNVYSRWQKWIDSKTGKRSDVAHHYLYTQQGNPNLTIASGVLVKRVIFEGTKATGIEYQYNPVHHGAEKSQAVHSVAVKKLVVVSGGAFGSPGVLERSGVGRKDVLSKFDIKTVVELEGVGENYQDHNLIYPSFHAAPESDTLDALHRGEPEAHIAAGTEWATTGKGLLATNGVDAGIKYRFTERDLEELGPAFRKRWNSYLADAKDKSALIMVQMSTLFGDPTKVAPSKYFTLGAYTMYPVSMGSVHISSATDIWANPVFHDNFLSCEEDITPLIWAYKRMREIARRMPSYRGEVTNFHPKFPEGSEAETKDVAQPVHIDAKDIAWTKEDEKIIENYVRDNVATTWHSLGTCAMKPREQGGVVDSRLNVYGTSSLKVADLSICPSNVAANTYSTAVAVGERASIIIAEDLGIKLA